MFVVSMALGLCALASLGCASSSPRIKNSEPTVIVSLAGAEDLRRYRVGPDNPFIEQQSVLIARDYRFLTFRLDIADLHGDILIKSVNLYRQGALVASRVLYADDLIQYWSDISTDDSRTMKLRGIIGGLVPASDRFKVGNEGTTRFLVAIVHDLKDPIDAWHITLAVNGRDVEYSNSL
jgi:hypothetical protein